MFQPLWSSMLKNRDTGIQNLKKLEYIHIYRLPELFDFLLDGSKIDSAQSKFKG